MLFQSVEFSSFFFCLCFCCCKLCASRVTIIIENSTPDTAKLNKAPVQYSLYTHAAATTTEATVINGNENFLVTWTSQFLGAKSVRVLASACIVKIYRWKVKIKDKTKRLAEKSVCVIRNMRSLFTFVRWQTNSV